MRIPVLTRHLYIETAPCSYMKRVFKCLCHLSAWGKWMPQIKATMLYCCIRKARALYAHTDPSMALVFSKAIFTQTCQVVIYKQDIWSWKSFILFHIIFCIKWHRFEPTRAAHSTTQMIYSVNCGIYIPRYLGICFHYRPGRYVAFK